MLEVIPMNLQEAKALAENLKELACIECTKGWLKEHHGLTDPIQDINACGALGLISYQLQERLIDEVKRINDTKTTLIIVITQQYSCPVCLYIFI